MVFRGQGNALQVDKRKHALDDHECAVVSSGNFSRLVEFRRTSLYAAYVKSC